MSLPLNSNQDSPTDNTSDLFRHSPVRKIDFALCEYLIFSYKFLSIIMRVTICFWEFKNDALYHKVPKFDSCYSGDGNIYYHVLFFESYFN